MFGVSCAPELFQKVMESVLAGLEGVVIYLDDVMVYGTNQDEHDKRLAAALQRLSEYGIMLNDQKCVYNAESLEFLGHELSAIGIRPKESRLSAIQQFREPQNVSELRSFLGLVCYVGRFIPHLAAKTDCLRQLLRAKVPFKWTEKEKIAFNSIKTDICKIEHLGFFNPKHRTKLITDASPTGLGAVLLQEDMNGQTKIIAFASKALTDLERKYFQTEREALSLVWGVEKFKLYLQGRKFVLMTDCKALKFLFSTRSKPCARIERWVLRLQAYTYDVEHIPGNANIADAISRLSLSSPEHFDEPVDAFIRTVAEQSAVAAIEFGDIVKATQEDEVIQKVMIALQTKSFDDVPREFKPFTNELCGIEGVLLRGTRLVIPRYLQHRVLEAAHEAHPGIAAMKRRLRQKVWWPGIDKNAEDFVKNCKQCILVGSIGVPEPIRRSRMPDNPWTDIAVDFMGPLPSGHSIFVMVDYYSRFTEAVVMKQTTAKRTVDALHETFCRFGMPETIRSDNGPQFISEELKSFCAQYGIKLLKTTPYWPQANGEVERANRAILKRLKISQLSENTDWIWDLRSFLLMYNSTPHATTGVSPSKLMFGRILRDKIPVFGEMGRRADDEEIRDRDWTNKIKGAEYADARRGAKQSVFKEGETVVTKRMTKDNKLSSSFEPEECIIVSLDGPEATLRSTKTDRLFKRNVAHLKLFPRDAHAETMMTSEEDITVRAGTGEDHCTVGEGKSERANQTNPSTKLERPTRTHRKPTYLDEYRT